MVAHLEDNAMQGDIEKLVDGFVADLQMVVREQILIEVTAALGGQATASKKRAKNGAVAARGKKRDPEALAALVESLYKQIKKTPESSIEELSSAMGIASKDLTLPAKKLIAEKRVRTKGQKRGTRYIAK